MYVSWCVFVSSGNNFPDQIHFVSDFVPTKLWMIFSIWPRVQEHKKIKYTSPTLLNSALEPYNYDLWLYVLYTFSVIFYLIKKYKQKLNIIKFSKPMYIWCIWIYEPFCLRSGFANPLYLLDVEAPTVEKEPQCSNRCVNDFYDNKRSVICPVECSDLVITAPFHCSPITMRSSLTNKIFPQLGWW